MHLSGTVGSPLAFWWVALRTEGILPRASAVCWALFLVLVAVQVLAFLLGVAGVRRLGPLGAVRHVQAQLRTAPEDVIGCHCPLGPAQIIDLRAIKPAAQVLVFKTADEDSIKIVEAVKRGPGKEKMQEILRRIRDVAPERSRSLAGL